MVQKAYLCYVVMGFYVGMVADVNKWLSHKEGTLSFFLLNINIIQNPYNVESLDDLSVHRRWYCSIMFKTKECAKFFFSIFKCQIWFFNTSGIQVIKGPAILSSHIFIFMSQLICMFITFVDVGFSFCFVSNYYYKTPHVALTVLFWLP